MKLIDSSSKFLSILCISIIILVIISSIITWPHEDAAILYSYSRSLSETGVISYFNGGERAEGATAFGWMILISALQKIGIVDNHFSTGLLNALSIIAFGIRLRFLSIRQNAEAITKTDDVYLPLILFYLIFFVSGSAAAGLGGFSTIAQVSLIGIIAISAFFEVYDWMFLLSSCTFILLRPDSIVYYIAIIIPGILIRLYLTNSPKSRNIGLSCVAPFVFFSYWIWRSLYFGSTFPLPYYVKASKSFASIIHSFFLQFANGINHLSFVVVCFAMALYLVSTRNKLRKTDLLNGTFAKLSHKSKFYLDRLYNEISLAPELKKVIVMYATFFSIQSIYLSRYDLSQNISDRFHAPIIGLSASLLAAVILITPRKIYAFNVIIKKCFSVKYIFLLVAIIFIFCAQNARSIVSGYYYLFLSKFNDNITPLAIDLNKVFVGDGSMQMFVTEAGRLSYYSKVPSVDAWGLNTKKYSKVPLNSPCDVISAKPDIINIHMQSSWLLDKVFTQPVYCNSTDTFRKNNFRGERSWMKMTQSLAKAGFQMNYMLYAVPCDKRHYNKLYRRHDLYFVNPDSTSFKKIKSFLIKHGAIPVSNIRDLKYNWN